MKKFLSLILFIGLAVNADAQLLWKISGKGLTAPSYIFGTHHLAPLSIKDSIATLPAAWGEVQQVYGEVVMADMVQPDILQTMQQQMMLPADTTLQSLFGTLEYEAVGKVVKEYMGIDVEMLKVLKPAAINQQLNVIICMKHMPGFNPQEQLDTYFQMQAMAEQKKVGGLESIQSQIDVLFNSQSLRRQSALLYCLASDVEKTVEENKTLSSAYMRQDLGTLQQLLEKRNGDSCDPLPEEMEALIGGRNKAWVEKMPDIMQGAPTLFVVGAGHLPGPCGVLALLQAAGYTVEAQQ